MPPRTPRALLLLECCVLLALLVTPGALLVLGQRGHDDVLMIEKRTPAAPPPTLSLPSLPEWLAELQTWFDDALPLRGAFVSELNAALLALGESGDDTVIVGREGFLFLDRTLADHQRTARFGAQRFELSVRATLARREWLDRQGSEYVLLIPPNKASVYPERMSPHYPVGSGPTLKDRFVERFADTPELHVLDLRDTLLAHKPDGELYYRSDSHWNLRGALLGLSATHARVASFLPGFTAPEWNQLRLRDHVTIGGDLAQVLGLHEVIRERVPLARERWTPAWRTWQPPSELRLPPGTRVRVFDNPEGHGTALFVHDSFGAQLLPWIGKPFARFYELTRASDLATNDTRLLELVRATRPDVVLDEIVERAFNAALPLDPEVWK
ncbi:MAG: hypothetical protein DHS20C15_30180 [Planctomycetota bacterium]|nr:MAG: hypothetical protein DHS20C15_30180 [Planctomycetota bacterium]